MQPKTRLIAAVLLLSAPVCAGLLFGSAGTDAPEAVMTHTQSHERSDARGAGFGGTNQFSCHSHGPTKHHCH